LPVVEARFDIPDANSEGGEISGDGTRRVRRACAAEPRVREFERMRRCGAVIVPRCRSVRRRRIGAENVRMRCSISARLVPGRAPLRFRPGRRLPGRPASQRTPFGGRPGDAHAVARGILVASAPATPKDLAHDHRATRHRPIAGSRRGAHAVADRGLTAPPAGR